MSEVQTISILKEEVPCSSERRSIHELRYFPSNPRVNSKLQEEESLPDDYEEKQNIIQNKMWQESSVKNLIPDIKLQGGVMEPILVMYSTKEVIEGNSRLAALRQLNDKDPNDERWQTIPCQVVTITQDQIDAYLHQIHVKGKTPWLKYAKAHTAYKRIVVEDANIEAYAEIVGETVAELEKQINIINAMRENHDRDRFNFSYYETMLRNKKIKDACDSKPFVKDALLKEIKKQDKSFTALDMRNKLPAILVKKKILKKFTCGEETLDESYQQAKPSDPLKKIKSAIAQIKSIEITDISSLEKTELNKITLEIKGCKQSIDRLKKMLEQQQS